MTRISNAVLAISYLALSIASAHSATLRMGTQDDPDALDPALSGTGVGSIIFTSLCDKLVDISHDLNAHFSDRGHLFQADRGRRFRAIVDAQGMRASEGLNVSQSSKRSEVTHREAACWIATSQTYPRRRAALATYRPTRWVSRLGH